MNSIEKKQWGREAFWVVFGLIVSVLTLLIGTRLLTTLLPAKEYGRLALSLSVAAFAVQVIATPISLTVIRFYTEWHEKGLTKILIINLSRYLKVPVLILLVLIIFAPLVLEWFGEESESELFLLTVFFSMMLILVRLSLGFLDATRQRRRRALLQSLVEIFRFILAISLIVLVGDGTAEWTLLGFLVATFMVFLVSYTLLDKKQMEMLIMTRKCANELHEENVSDLKGFLHPLFFSALFIWIVMMSDRWALLYFGDEADVGGYAAIYQLAFMPMLLISNFLTLFILPILFQYVGVDKDHASKAQALMGMRYVSFVILGAAIIGLIVLNFFHINFGQILLGPEFRGYSWIFPWLFFAGGCFAASQQLLVKLSCDLRTRQLALLWGAISVIAVLSYCSGAWVGGTEGLVIAVSAVNFLLLLFSLFISFQKEAN